VGALFITLKQYSWGLAALLVPFVEETGGNCTISLLSLSANTCFSSSLASVILGSGFLMSSVEMAREVLGLGSREDSALKHS
jgi:hypothetical protein